jgi:hypothetical protein
MSRLVPLSVWTAGKRAGGGVTLPNPPRAAALHAVVALMTVATAIGPPTTAGQGTGALTLVDERARFRCLARVVLLGWEGSGRTAEVLPCPERSGQVRSVSV